MTYKFPLLLPVFVLSLSACTLEPYRFTGTDLLAPDEPKKEEKNLVAKSDPVVLKAAPIAPKPAVQSETILNTEEKKTKIVETKETTSPPKAPLVIPVLPPAKPIEKKAECPDVKKENISATQMLKKDDRIKITVFRENDLTGVYQVDDAGYIAFPLIGKIAAANQTAKTLQDNIKKKLASGYLINPEVTADILPECNEK